MSVTISRIKEIDGAVGELYKKYLTTTVAKNYIAANSASELEKENVRKMESYNKKKPYLIVRLN